MAGVLWYGLAILIVVGALFAGGLGGAVTWAAFWIVVALIVYIVVSKVWGSVT
jgi:hypothetical protein